MFDVVTVLRIFLIGFYELNYDFCVVLTGLLGGWGGLIPRVETRGYDVGRPVRDFRSRFARKVGSLSLFSQIPLWFLTYYLNLAR